MEITQEQLEQAVVNGLNRGSVDKKYIDIGRIPFICDDIREIKDSIRDAIGEDGRLTKHVAWTVKMIYLAIGGLTVVSLLIIPVLVALIQRGSL